MLLSKLEKEFSNDMTFGHFEKLDALLKTHPKIIKSIGAQVWQIALQSNNKEKSIQLLIDKNAPVFMPRPTAATIKNDPYYTLSLAIEYKSHMLLKYMLLNFKVHKKLLNYVTIKLCNIKPFSEQGDMLRSLINAGADISYNNHRAMLNATFLELGEIVTILVEQGSYLINQKCAELYLKHTQQAPYEYMLECKDERNLPAIINIISMKKEDDTPIDFLGDSL